MPWEKPKTKIDINGTSYHVRYKTDLGRITNITFVPVAPSIWDLNYSPFTVIGSGAHFVRDHPERDHWDIVSLARPDIKYEHNYTIFPHEEKRKLLLIAGSVMLADNTGSFMSDIISWLPKNSTTQPECEKRKANKLNETK